jgi:pseudouridine-5'-phosphate glycosidase
MNSAYHSFFDYSDEVKQAQQAGRPILALESTLITHGLPFPQNIETALLLEKTARENGVTPATIAIIQGKIKIGINKAELETLTQDKQIVKASTRDLAFVLSQNQNAGTTVAATLFCAEAAGIKVFATGGIGGVHRGQDQDISADLIALSKSSTAVVCAGAKAILDLPKTLEFLETHNIPVIGYRTDTFPAFYTAETKHKLVSRVDDIDALANILKTHWQLGMVSGILIANPIPAADEIASDIIEPAIANAIQEAEKQGIKGKAITPFLLNEVRLATQNKSLQANISLIVNNVRLGAKLAKRIV